MNKHIIRKRQKVAEKMKKLFAGSVITGMVTGRKLTALVALTLFSTGAFSTPVTPELSLQEAERLSEMPLHCVTTEYPNKLNQTLSGPQDLQGPASLHPAFYGCFDWHSSVHGHWMLVNLLRHFPDLAKTTEIKAKLKENLTTDKILQEVAYFEKPQNASFERTYGWAWLLALAAELKLWDDPLAAELSQNLSPLTELIVGKYHQFLPKLVYPVRTGEHPNTAFGMSMALDYALIADDKALQTLITDRAVHWFGGDKQCPLSWEPNGFDFLSPCFEELDLMRKVMDKKSFMNWAEGFLPALDNADFHIDVARVSDRTDGKLVHLDGLNFSRAWVMYGLAAEYPDEFGHLRALADTHVTHSLPAIVDENYEGTHWLGSFAVYALQQRARAGE